MEIRLEMDAWRHTVDPDTNRPTPFGRPASDLRYINDNFFPNKNKSPYSGPGVCSWIILDLKTSILWKENAEA